MRLPAFPSSFLSPWLLGVSAHYEGGDNWLLTGCALEYFIPRFLEIEAPKPELIGLSAKIEVKSVIIVLLLPIISLIYRSPSWEWSPFDNGELIAGVYRASRNRDFSGLKELDRWIVIIPEYARSKRAVLHGGLN